jgi:arylsulfatase A
MCPVVRFLAVSVLILAACFPRAGFAAPVGPLNIVLILADDLGWADLGCHGADLHETPRIDAFAREGEGNSAE